MLNSIKISGNTDTLTHIHRLMNEFGFEVGWSKYYKACPITLEL